MGRKGISPLEEGLKKALTSLDNQVAREMQRTPTERQEQGVRKWEPYRKRVENVTGLLVEYFGDGEVQLDSLLISSQAYVKALRIIMEELEERGLGEVRSEYCKSTLESIAEDLRKADRSCRDEEIVN